MKQAILFYLVSKTLLRTLITYEGKDLSLITSEGIQFHHFIQKLSIIHYLFIPLITNSHRIPYLEKSKISRFILDFIENCYILYIFERAYKK